MKQVGYIFIILFIFAIQTTFINAISIEGIKPNLLLVYVVIIAFLNGEYDGLFVGIVTGLFHDSFFAQYIGGNLFLYAIIGYITGIVCKDYFKGNVISPIIVTLFSTIAFGIGNFILNVMLHGFINIGYYLFIRVLPEVIYNCLFSFILFMIISFVRDRMGTKRRKNTKYI